MQRVRWSCTGIAQLSSADNVSMCRVPTHDPYVMSVMTQMTKYNCHQSDPVKGNMLFETDQIMDLAGPFIIWILILTSIKM